MNWIQKIITWVMGLFGGQTTGSSDTQESAAWDSVADIFTGEHARITAVYTGTADKYAVDMPIMSIMRKSQLLYNMYTPWKADTALSVSMELNGNPLVLDEMGSTCLGMTKSEQHVGKTNAYGFRTPEPNGYPVGTYETAEIVVRDQNGLVIDRHAFVLIVQAA